MKRIEIPIGFKKTLMEKFQTSSPTVWAALNFITKSDFAKQIRAEAIRMGGITKSDDPDAEPFIPNCETVYEKENGVLVRMVQKFSNDVKVIVHLQSSIIQLYHKRELVADSQDAKLTVWSEFVYKAQKLSGSLTEE